MTNSKSSNIKFFLLVLLLLLIVIVSFGNADIAKTAEDLNIKRKWHTGELVKTREKLEQIRKRSARLKKQLRYFFLPLSRLLSVGLICLLCFCFDWFGLLKINSPADFILNFQIIALGLASLNFIIFGRIANWNGSAQKIEDFIVKKLFTQLPELEKEELELQESESHHQGEIQKLDSDSSNPESK